MTVSITTDNQHHLKGANMNLRRPEPCAIVILGASGDLTARKIVPSLFRLFLFDRLPERFFILGCARTAMSNESFREKMRQTCLQGNKDHVEAWQSFSDASQPLPSAHASFVADPRGYHRTSHFGSDFSGAREVHILHLLEIV